MPICIKRARVAAFAVAVLVLGLTNGPASAAESSFPTWLQGLRSEALAHGIGRQTVDLALDNLAPIPRVLELDRKQPEFTLSFSDYIARVVSDARVEKGRQLLAENRDLLEQIAGTYGVQPRFILALWGIESDYGRITGDFPVIPALATLAYDGRRSSYFRGELLDALRILDRGFIDLTTLRGSWAGALGQNQFMPSSYLRYAVDFEGKGRRDIWHNRADVLASTANFLLHAGWQADETWGREVRLPEGFDASLVDLSIKKTLAEWASLGVIGAEAQGAPDSVEKRRASPANGGSLSAGDAASLVLPAGAGEPAYLVYDNYRAIMKWNRSTFFATAVGLLADRIGDR